MLFQPFHDFYPDLAEAETRFAILEEPQNGLPADTYAIMETYCNEPGCDCRRVIFMVCAKRHREPLAYVAYGWDSRKFYARWLHSDNPDDIDELQGPILNFGSPQSKYALSLLGLIKYVVLADPAYIERLKRHYRLVREAVDRNAPRLPPGIRLVRNAFGKGGPFASAPVLDRRLDAAERKRILAAKMRELKEQRSQKKKRAR
jgi:hypothetical protein